MKLGILTDIHEDSVNLKKALNIFEKNTCDEIVCLGDIVGFSHHYERYSHHRNASECLNIVKQNCRYIVAGNHDHYAAKVIPEYRGGFPFPSEWYILTMEERKKKSAGKVWLYEDELPSNLKDKDYDFIRSLPEYIILNSGAINIIFSHFLFPDITGSTTSFPKSVNEISSHFDFMKKNECSLGFCGHIHPEGLLIASEDKKPFFSIMRNTLTFFPFGITQLKKRNQVVAVPAVIMNERNSGVTIFDSNNFEINTIKIK